MDLFSHELDFLVFREVSVACGEFVAPVDNVSFKICSKEVPSIANGFFLEKSCDSCSKKLGQRQQTLCLCYSSVTRPCARSRAHAHTHIHTAIVMQSRVLTPSQKDNPPKNTGWGELERGKLLWEKYWRDFVQEIFPAIFEDPSRIFPANSRKIRFPPMNAQTFSSTPFADCWNVFLF